MSSVRKAEIELPSPYLESANWADAFEVLASDRELTARSGAQKALAAKPPRWVRSLMGLRNRIAGLIGLKAAEPSISENRIGAFPIVEQSDDTIVLGFDDWHLDFRIVVDVRNEPAGNLVKVATLVNRKHWFGYLYIFLITPFHKIIVKRLLSNLAKPTAVVST